MNRRSKIPAQVHRFHDCVAIYIGTGETVYLTPKEARQLARAINKTARSCDREEFRDHTAGTHSFTFGDVR